MSVWNSKTTIQYDVDRSVIQREWPKQHFWWVLVVMAPSNPLQYIWSGIFMSHAWNVLQLDTVEWSRTQLLARQRDVAVGLLRYSWCSRVLRLDNLRNFARIAGNLISISTENIFRWMEDGGLRREPFERRVQYKQNPIRDLMTTEEHCRVSMGGDPVTTNRRITCEHPVIQQALVSTPWIRAIYIAHSPSVRGRPRFIR